MPRPHESAWAELSPLLARCKAQEAIVHSDIGGGGAYPVPGTKLPPTVVFTATAHVSFGVREPLAPMDPHQLAVFVSTPSATAK